MIKYMGRLFKNQFFYLKYDVCNIQNKKKYSDNAIVLRKCKKYYTIKI